MKLKKIKLSVWLLSIQCGVCIALAPIIPQLHQAFANHNHIYCPQHHRIEDAGLKQSPHARLEESPLTATLKSTTRNEAADFYFRPVCLFSNLLVHATNPKPTLQLDPTPIESQAIKALIDVNIAVLDIVLFAPKHSPPNRA